MPLVQVRMVACVLGMPMQMYVHGNRQCMVLQSGVYELRVFCAPHVTLSVQARVR